MFDDFACKQTLTNATRTDDDTWEKVIEIKSLCWGSTQNTLTFKPNDDIIQTVLPQVAQWSSARDCDVMSKSCQKTYYGK